MSVKLVVPSLGTEVTEGIVVEWIKSVGEMVKAGEPVVVIGTPKLNLEVEAPVTGVLSEANAEIDDVVEVGATSASLTRAGPAHERRRFGRRRQFRIHGRRAARLLRHARRRRRGLHPRPRLCRRPHDVAPDPAGARSQGQGLRARPAGRGPVEPRRRRGRHRLLRQHRPRTDGPCRNRPRPSRRALDGRVDRGRGRYAPIPSGSRR